MVLLPQFVTFSSARYVDRKSLCVVGRQDVRHGDLGRGNLVQLATVFAPE